MTKLVKSKLNDGDGIGIVLADENRVLHYNEKVKDWLLTRLTGEEKEVKLQSTEQVPRTEYKTGETYFLKSFNQEHRSVYAKFLGYGFITEDLEMIGSMEVSQIFMVNKTTEI
jgi:hypothetical protein